MREKDKSSIGYLEDSARFADFINGYAFEGREVLKRENIRERKRTYTVNGKKDKGESWSITRDIVKESEIESVIVLIALENQSDIHYAMPIRVMRGDVANYYEQWRKIGKQHEENKDLRGAEFLSLFSKHDKLVPVITICTYWGEEPWDGPKCLKDMLNLQGMPEEMGRLLGDYPLHLIEVNTFPHPEYFQTDLRVVFEFLRNRSDKEKMKKYIEENKEILENISGDTYDFISEMSNLKELEELKDLNKNNKGGYDMCRGMREWLDETREEGRQSGIRLAKKVISMSTAGRSYDEISKSCEISLEEVMEILEVSVA